MCKFQRIIFSNDNDNLINLKYLPEIIDLMRIYKHKIFDDYFLKNNFSKSVFSLIKELSPHFWVMLTPKKHSFIGFVFLDDWKGASNALHSVTFTTCMKREFWGKYTIWAAKRFIAYVFKKYKVIKLKAEVFSTNHLVQGTLKKLGFKHEATLLDETISNGKSVDLEIYSIKRKEK